MAHIRGLTVALAAASRANASQLSLRDLIATRNFVFRCRVGRAQCRHRQGADRAGDASFDWLLSDDQVAAVVTYIRNAWGNAAPAVSASEVGKTRQALVERSDWAGSIPIVPTKNISAMTAQFCRSKVSLPC